MMFVLDCQEILEKMEKLNVQAGINVKLLFEVKDKETQEFIKKEETVEKSKELEQLKKNIKKLKDIEKFEINMKNYLEHFENEHKKLNSLSLKILNYIRENIGFKLPETQFEKKDYREINQSYAPLLMSKCRENEGNNDIILEAKFENLQSDENILRLIEPVSNLNYNLPNFEIFGDGGDSLEAIFKYFKKLGITRTKDQMFELILSESKTLSEENNGKEEVKRKILEKINEKMKINFWRKKLNNLSDLKKKGDNVLVTRNKKIIRSETKIGSEFIIFSTNNDMVRPSKEIKSAIKSGGEKSEIRWSYRKKFKAARKELNNKKNGEFYNSPVVHHKINSTSALKYALVKIMGALDRRGTLTMCFHSDGVNHFFHNELDGTKYLQFNVPRKLCTTKKLRAFSKRRNVYCFLNFQRYCPVMKKSTLINISAYYYADGIKYDTDIGKYVPVKKNKDIGSQPTHISQQGFLNKESDDLYKTLYTMVRVNNIKKSLSTDVLIGHWFLDHLRSHTKDFDRSMNDKGLRGTQHMLAFQANREYIKIFFIPETVANDDVTKVTKNGNVFVAIRIQDFPRNRIITGHSEFFLDEIEKEILEQEEKKNKNLGKEKKKKNKINNVGATIIDFQILSKEFWNSAQNKMVVKNYLVMITNYQLIIVDVNKFKANRNQSFDIFDLVDIIDLEKAPKYMENMKDFKINSLPDKLPLFKVKRLFCRMTNEDETPEIDAQIFYSYQSDGKERAYFINYLRFKMTENYEKFYKFNANECDPLKAFAEENLYYDLKTENLMDEGGIIHEESSKLVESNIGSVFDDDNSIDSGKKDDNSIDSGKKYLDLEFVDERSSFLITASIDYKISPDVILDGGTKIALDKGKPEFVNFYNPENIHSYTIDDIKLDFSLEKKAFMLICIVNRKERINSKNLHCDQTLIYTEIPEFNNGDKAFNQFSYRKILVANKEREIKELENINFGDEAEKIKNEVEELKKEAEMRPKLKLSSIYCSSKKNINGKNPPVNGIFLKGCESHPTYKEKSVAGYFSTNFELIYLNFGDAYEKNIPYYLEYEEVKA